MPSARGIGFANAVDCLAAVREEYVGLAILAVALVIQPAADLSLDMFDASLAPAQFAVGVLYAEGRGVERNELVLAARQRLRTHLGAFGFASLVPFGREPA